MVAGQVFIMSLSVISGAVVGYNKWKYGEWAFWVPGKAVMEDKIARTYEKVNREIDGFTENFAKKSEDEKKALIESLKEAYQKPYVSTYHNSSSVFSIEGNEVVPCTAVFDMNSSELEVLPVPGKKLATFKEVADFVFKKSNEGKDLEKLNDVEQHIYRDVNERYYFFSRVGLGKTFQDILKGSAKNEDISVKNESDSDDQDIIIVDYD